MLKISPETQVQLSDLTVYDTASQYGVGVADFRETPEGISNTVVEIIGTDGLAYYLKYYRSTHDRARVEQEVSFVNDLASAGLPVPAYLRPKEADIAIVGQTDGNGEHATTLTLGISGQHPDKYPPELLQQLGATHARIHLFSERYGRTQDFDPTKKYHFYNPSPDESALITVDADTQQLLEKMRDIWPILPGGLAPMDIKRNNILVDELGLCGIIDFADIEMAPSSFCLAGTLWDVFEANGGSLRDIAAYVAAYESVKPLNALEKSCLMDIIAIRGWVALHGTLLTEGHSPTAQYQASLIGILRATEPQSSSSYSLESLRALG